MLVTCFWRASFRDTCGFISRANFVMVGVDAVVVVTYPDQSFDLVPIKVMVISDAATYDPFANPLVKKFGEGTSEADVTAQVQVPGYPDSATPPEIAVDDPAQLPDGQHEGRYTVDVTVTYPDETTDKLQVPVTVLPEGVQPKPFQKDVYTPEAQPETIRKGDPYDLTDNVSVPDYVEDPAHPGQPVYSDVTPVGQIDPNKAGDYTGLVLISDPDGSKETLEVPVKVLETMAGQNQPTGQNVDVNLNETANPADNIANREDLPEGTTFAYKEVPDSSTPGIKPVVVIVSYPDGSTEEVAVIIRVRGKLPEPQGPGNAQSGVGGEGALPATGERNDLFAYASLLILAALVLLGLHLKRKTKG